MRICHFYYRIFYRLKIKVRNLPKTIKVALFGKPELLFWASTGRDNSNFGDALNPWLFKKIKRYEPIDAKVVVNILRRDVFSCIGSILGWSKRNNIIVWGSGFISSSSVLKRQPKKICAVRGPLSRAKLLEFGVPCPEVYGDPALLLPKYYHPQIEKKYKLGVIPHYVDKDNKNFQEFSSILGEDITVIDVEQSVEHVIDRILECEKTISSSLHGIVVSDAYGIPSLRVKFSDNVYGGDFKFNDYYLSVKRDIINPICIDADTKLEEILESFSPYTISIDLARLLESCPFMK